MKYKFLMFQDLTSYFVFRVFFCCYYVLIEMQKMALIGFRVVACPSKGFSYYCAAEFHSDGIAAQDVLAPNETTYIDITLYIDLWIKMFSVLIPLLLVR